MDKHQLIVIVITAVITAVSRALIERTMQFSAKIAKALTKRLMAHPMMSMPEDWAIIEPAADAVFLGFMLSQLVSLCASDKDLTRWDVAAISFFVLMSFTMLKFLVVDWTKFGIRRSISRERRRRPNQTIQANADKESLQDAESGTRRG